MNWFQWYRFQIRNIAQHVQGVVGEADNTKIRLYTILEKSKETFLGFYKRTAKVLWKYVNGWIQ